MIPPLVHSEPLSDEAFRLSCLLAASPERVFRAWTSPEELVRWFGPSDGLVIEIHELDPSPGGAYNLTIRGESDWTVLGRYLVVEPPHRLSFTWRWTTWEEGRDSQVHINLDPEEGWTRLTLTHEMLGNAEARDLHTEGWQETLQRLAARLQEE